MNTLNLITLQAAQGGGGMSGLLMIVAMIAIFYFFMIRPQSKKQKELKRQREAMRKGDRVITSGGIHGRIREISENTINIEIANGVVIKINKDSVFPIIDDPKAPKKEAKESPKNEEAAAE